MMDALIQLGAKFEWEDSGRVLVVHGTGGKFLNPTKPIYLSNAGTASRFLTSTMTLLKGAKSILTGNKRMKERPIGPLVKALTEHGCKLKYMESEGKLANILQHPNVLIICYKIETRLSSFGGTWNWIKRWQVFY